MLVKHALWRCATINRLVWLSTLSWALSGCERLAGISACKHLHDKGVKDIIILEARHEIGGRMMTHTFGDVVIEKGANWIEGTDGPQVNPILPLCQGDWAHYWLFPLRKHFSKHLRRLVSIQKPMHTDLACINCGMSRLRFWLANVSRWPYNRGFVNPTLALSQSEMVEQLYESTGTLSEDLTKGEEMDVSVSCNPTLLWQVCCDVFQARFPHD